MSTDIPSALNGNLAEPIYFLKAKHVYTVRNMEKDKWVLYILVSAG
jgi:hypothetical protein